MIPAYIIAILICILCSAFFSASEMALSSANRMRLENAAENGNRHAATAVRLIERYDDALSAILVGNNLVNIAASSLGTLAAIAAYGTGSEWISTAIITVLVIICGETIPKIVAQKNANRMSLAVAPFVRFITFLFFPVTFLVTGLVKGLTLPLKAEQQTEDEDQAVEELHSIIDTAEDENILDEGESELVSAAIDFSEISVQEVMTARVDVVSIDIEDALEVNAEIIVNASCSRIPVYEGVQDEIIGVLQVNHYLKAVIDDPAPDIRSLLLPASYVYKTMKLPAVLSQLRESRQHLAIVTDEYGGTLGVVTLEDVMEELVGEIWDETDTVEREIREVEEGIWDIDGDTQFSDLIELYGWDENEADFASETVGGWTIEMLDGFPEAGATFEYGGMRFTVLKADERRVLKVRAENVTGDDPESITAPAK